MKTPPVHRYWFSVLGRPRLWRALLCLLTINCFLITASRSDAAFTEFYCDAASGSNLNSGSTTSASAAYTATNGGWNSGTGVFTPTSGNPSLTVSVGDFASVYTDGASVTGFIGRVTAVNSTTITVSTSAKSGTAPTTAGSGISCKVGGAWKGPNGAEAFPFGFITSAQKANVSNNNYPRVNLKNNATYSITAALTHGNGLVQFQGYGTTPGDEGRATIDGGTSGASYTLATFSAAGTAIGDLIFQNNGATGTADGVVVSGSRAVIWGCVFNNFRGNGLLTSNSTTVVRSEAYGCNQSNTAATGGFKATSTTWYYRVISHDNTGSNSSGFVSSTNVAYSHSIADTNGAHGYEYGGNVNVNLSNCDAYNNGGDGARAGAAASFVENCNFVKNGGWGFNQASNTPVGFLTNCGFGSGTQANTSGTFNTGQPYLLQELNSITYAADVTPWVDPANGDFRINLAAARGAGRGAFTQTASGYAGTIGYPDIGAAQSQGGGGVSRSRTLP